MALFIGLSRKYEWMKYESSPPSLFIWFHFLSRGPFPSLSSLLWHRTSEGKRLGVWASVLLHLTGHGASTCPRALQMTHRNVICRHQMCVDIWIDLALVWCHPLVELCFLQFWGLGITGIAMLARRTYFDKKGGRTGVKGRFDRGTKADNLTEAGKSRNFKSWKHFSLFSYVSATICN